jgi:hypothetical protein
MIKRPLTASAVAAVLIACASLTLSSAAGQTPTAKSCMPVSVATTLGTFTYRTRVEAGSVGCGLARSVLRDAADWPPGTDSAAASRWRCTVGQQADRWAISCARSVAIVRAYGPLRERNPWVIAAARLRIGVMAPISTPGLVLRHLRLRPCGGRKWLVADYSRSDGATLTIAEGRPHTCANLGVSPQLAVWRIHGRRASLLEFCAPAGCARFSGDYALDWRERGIEITLLTHGLRQAELFAVARGMTALPA